MANFDPIYELLRTKPEFQEEVHGLLKCGICKDVMVSASFTSCGCDFCHDCIVGHLAISNPLCPVCNKGITTEIKHKVTNDEKIKNLTVKCSNNNCNVINTVVEMVQHIRSCDMRKMTCPFAKVGCRGDEFDGVEAVKLHLSSEIVKHNELLVEDHMDVKNTINKLRDDNDEKNNIINEMKRKMEIFTIRIDQYDENKMEMEERIRELEGNKEEIRRDLDETKDLIDRYEENRVVMGERVKGELEELKNMVGRCEGNRIEMEERMKRKLENTSREITRQQTDTKNQTDAISAELINLRSDFENQLREISATSSRLNSINNLLKCRIQTIEKQKRNDKDKILNLEKDFSIQNEKLRQQILLDNQFVWKIEKMSEKRKEASEGHNIMIEKNQFHTHNFGYKMRLRICPNGYGSHKGSHLSVFFVIMKGEFDNINQWPFRRQVRISIINQKSLEDVNIENFHIDSSTDSQNIYYKPTDIENKAYGYTDFISWNELNNSPHLLKDDVIFIRCTTSL